MPKFYHAKDTCGIDFKARAVGWRSIPPLSFLPYLTSESILIRLSIKNLSVNAQWEQGTLTIDPSILDNEWGISLSETPFQIKKTPIGKWWSLNIPVNRGCGFFEPCHRKCFAKLQNGENRQCLIHIADIDVVSRGMFITKILMWIAAPIIAYLLGKFL